MTPTITFAQACGVAAATSVHPDLVEISHGANEITMAVAGFSVGRVQRAVAQTLNVSPDALAFVNGKQVQGGHVLCPGDALEFLIERGGKGVGEVWTKTEFMRLYGMSDLDWADWVAKGLPYDIMHDGTVRLTETMVDDWMRTLREKKRSAAAQKPRWDRDTRRLYIGNQLVKRYRQRSGNQELVLAAFEDDGWPDRIDDPLPPKTGMSTKRRLSTTIASLNRCHRTKLPLIRFETDGNGEGVVWTVLDESSIAAPE